MWQFAPAERSPARRQLYLAGRVQGTEDKRRNNVEFRIVERWQAGRCAVCAQIPDAIPVSTRRGLVDRTALEADHDHDNGLFRGLLCQGCNGRESRAGKDDPLFSRYRFRYPAAMLGVRLRWAEPDSELAMRLKRQERYRAAMMQAAVEAGLEPVYGPVY